MQPIPLFSVNGDHFLSPQKPGSFTNMHVRMYRKNEHKEL